MDSDLQVHILWENELQLNMESMHCAYSKPIHCVDCVVQGNIHTPPPPPDGRHFCFRPLHHRPEIAFLGLLLWNSPHPLTPWNFRNFPTWLGTPWNVYVRQKCCRTVYCYPVFRQNKYQKNYESLFNWRDLFPLNLSYILIAVRICSGTKLYAVRSAGLAWSAGRFCFGGRVLIFDFLNNKFHFGCLSHIARVPFESIGHINNEEPVRGQ